MAKRTSNDTGWLTYRDGVVSAASFAAAYGLGSWAIDNGSLVLYALCVAAVYVGCRYAWLALKVNVEARHGTSRKAGKTRST